MPSSRNQMSLISITIFLLLLSSTLSAEKCHPDDKKTLFKIKKAFNNAYIFASWTNDTDCCQWYMVKCDRVTHRIYSLTVDKDDKVSGPIPDAVGDLPYLEILRFIRLPKVIGPIPHAISKLKNLTNLWLSHNNLTGPIPDFFSQLPKLTWIDLSVNKLTGPIPPSLSSLHKLNLLILERNQLQGPIPESFGEFKNIPNFYLRLAKNQLSGPIPRSLGAISFMGIDFSRNMFTGDASVIFGKNKEGLLWIDISRNKFSFDFTKVRFPKSLSNLLMSHNQIYGSLPPALGKLPMLQFFNVSYNRLCGNIPTGGQLQQFDQYSYAHNKCLCGSPLPPC
ncbi:polygalacturonase inhibitor-like [Chenopodium quinoa]|uniref:polygalacturonase inhibitor-like n=1 Tax=Chenopodium quinoa TaxID=63459 RepID=UPI000B7843DB|nr:polygalacturonase inhibitor-like [Chenopodium quinoa]